MGDHSGDSRQSGERNITTGNSNRKLVRRRSVLKTTGTSVVAATLAGCSTDSNGTTADESDGTDTATDSPTESPSGLSDPLSIGLLTTAELPRGESIINAVRLAVKEINQAGGIGGFRIDLTTENTGTDAEETRSAYRSITGDGGVDATLGLTFSNALRGAFESIAARETVHLNVGTGINVYQALGDGIEPNKYWFRVGPVNAVYQAEALAQFIADSADDYDWQRVAVLTENLSGLTPAHERLVEALSDSVEVPVAKQVGGVRSWSPIFDEIEQQGCDIVLPQFKFIGTKSLIQWRNQERQFALGGDLPVTALRKGPDEGGPFSQAMATRTAAVTDKTVPFAEAYQNEYGQSFTPAAFSAYDAVYVLKKAVERAGTTDSDALVSALEELSYTGTTGTIEFTGLDSEFPHDVKYGPDKVQPLYFQRQKTSDGFQRRVLWPEELQETEYQSPPWS